MWKAEKYELTQSSILIRDLNSTAALLKKVKLAQEILK